MFVEQGNIINMPQADVDSFIQPLITDNTEVMRRMEVLLFNSLIYIKDRCTCVDTERSFSGATYSSES